MSNQQLSEAAKQNLKANSELWKETSEFVKLEEGETTVLKSRANQNSRRD